MAVSRRQLELFHLKAQTYVAAAGVVSATMLSVASIYVGMQISRQTDERAKQVDSRSAEVEHRNFKFSCTSGFLQAYTSMSGSKASRRETLNSLLMAMPRECHALAEMRALIRNAQTMEQRSGEAAAPLSAAARARPPS